MDEAFFVESLEEIAELPSTEPIYVYVMYAEGTRWIKIGQATDVEFRRYQLQTGCPPPLKILWSTPTDNATTLEELLKAHFAPYALQGEWFTLPDDIPTVLDLLAFVYKQSQPAPLFTGPLSKLQQLNSAEIRITEALSKHSWLTIRDLMKSIGAAASQYNYIRRLLSNLTKRGIVGKFSYGKYCLVDNTLNREDL